MTEIPDEIIYPCAFSKGYGIPSRQAWLLLKIFFIYRLISAILFVMLFYLHFGTILAGYGSQLYQFTSLGYLLISILAAPLILLRSIKYSSLAQLFIFTDIIFITLLMHASGGVGSGIGILLAISIAAGGLLVGGRCAMLLAALASLAVLAEQIYAIETHSFESASLTYSGMLGVSFFSVVLLSYMLTKRSEQSELLAKQHAATIARLQELNRYIIQHLQSGIMIVNESQTIQLCNRSTLRLLNLRVLPEHLGAISPELQQAFKIWRINADRDFAIIHRENAGEIQVRFSLLKVLGERLHMLIFEDIALYNQRFQQNKLASLGRLTASIAHEIRNPLGAICHATQLLSEAPNLQAPDLRLTEIIQNHSRRINDIIESILKLSKRDALQKQRIALDEWLPAYLDEQHLNFGEFADSFTLNFKARKLNVYIDPGHLKQILDNLCQNALQYGRPDLGAISIVIDQLLDAPCIKVIDNGPGINAKNRQHLFEPFFTTSHKGTGLGLYISRELAELNQAELSYATYMEKPCFTLSLANADHVVIEL
jgi:two-component system sensor histidine kinase PilS (NtrC family)